MPFRRFADWFVVRRRWVAALILVLSLAAIVGLTRLDFDDVPRSVFRTDSADFDRLEQLFDDFGSDDNDCLIVIDAIGDDDLFTPKTLSAIRRISQQVEALTTIESVRSLADVVLVDRRGRTRSLLPEEQASLADYAAAREQAVAHPLLVGQVLSEDARTTLVLARLAGGSLAIAEVDPVLAQIRDVIAPFAARSDLRIRLTGVPTLRAEIFATVRRESVKFSIIGMVLGFAMAYLVFRRFGAVIIVASAPIFGSIWCMGALGLAGEKVNVINTVLPTLVMVIGFTDAVHLMIDIIRSRQQGMARLAAARTAIEHLGTPCALTSLTTAVGFGSLIVAQVTIIQKFGVQCAVGTVLTFIAVLTMVPLLSSSSLGDRSQPHDSGLLMQRAARRCAGLIRFVVNHPRSVAFGGTLVTLLFASSAFRLVPDNRLTETIPEANESCQALKHLDSVMGGTLNMFIVVEWPDSMTLESPEVFDAIRRAHDACQEHPATAYPLSLVNLLEAIPAGNDDELASRLALLPLAPQDLVGRFVRTDLRRAIITTRLQDVGTVKHEPTFQAIEGALADVESRYPGLELSLTGTSVVASRNINLMIDDLVKSLGLAAVVIFGVMTIVFRSFKYGLISILPNCFPMVTTAAILVATGQPLQLTSVIVFSICLGIAVDDTIHFLSRFRRELEIDGNVKASVERAFQAVGSALFTTTAVLLAGFGCVMLSEMPTSRLFAWLSCTAITSALIGDLILLPALLVCFVRDRDVANNNAAAEHATPSQLSASA